MSRTVWKFPLTVEGVFVPVEVEAPANAQVALVGLDPATGLPAIWLELNPDAPRETRRFEVVGTGHTVEGDGGYPFPIRVGSLIDGAFVWHVYEHRA